MPKNNIHVQSFTAKIHKLLCLSVYFEIKISKEVYSLGKSALDEIINTIKMLDISDEVIRITFAVRGGYIQIFYNYCNEKCTITLDTIFITRVEAKDMKLIS